MTERTIGLLRPEYRYGHKTAGLKSARRGSWTIRCECGWTPAYPAPSTRAENEAAWRAHVS